MSNIDEELQKKKQEFAEIDSAVDRKNAEYIKLIELIEDKKQEVVSINEKRSIAKSGLDKINNDIESQSKLLIDVDSVVEQKKQEVEDYKKIEIDLIEKQRKELEIQKKEFREETAISIESVNNELIKLKKEKEVFEGEKKLLYTTYEDDMQYISNKEKELAIREDNCATLEGELDAKQIELNKAIEYSYVSQNKLNILLGEMKQQKIDFEEYKKNENEKIKALRENAESHLETNRLLAKKEYEEIMDGLKEQQVELDKEKKEYERLSEECTFAIDAWYDQEEISKSVISEYELKIQELDEKLKNILDKENGIDVQKKQLEKEISMYIKLREDLEDKLNK